jgi:DNA-directed RNA polymerase subunit RPC12/RpoP
MGAEQEDARAVRCPRCDYRLDAIQDGVAIHPERGKTLTRSGPPPFEWGRLNCPECGKKLYLMRYIGSRHWGFAPVSHAARVRRDATRRLVRRAAMTAVILLGGWFALAVLWAFLSLVL